MSLIREFWDRFLLYLPLAFMATLSLGTYWLVRSSPQTEVVHAPRAASHDPDYYMQQFSVKSFDASGHVHSEVFGVQARHYPDTRLLEIDGIKIRSFDAKGRITTASADRGLSTEDSSEVQLIGNALIVREAQGSGDKASPRLEYRGEFLDALMRTEQVKSNKPVELLRGSDRFTADSLDYDNVEQVLRLKGRVRGILQSNPSK